MAENQIISVLFKGIEIGKLGFDVHKKTTKLLLSGSVNIWNSLY